MRQASGLKELLRYSLSKVGYRVTQLRPANRFQAMDDSLLLMKRSGYNPRVVVDGGAHIGTWTLMARQIFPQAEFHLIEPQPACASLLGPLAEGDSRLHFHPFALTEPGISHVRMIGGGAEGGGTGAFVALHREEAGCSGEISLPATTLDALFAGHMTPSDRALLKLDLEGHEIPALVGGSGLLESVEVILTELQFFEVNGNGRPVFADYLNFLRVRGFELYDFACLSQRSRDMRLRMGDVIFVRRNSPLLTDNSWE